MPKTPYLMDAESLADDYEGKEIQFVNTFNLVPKWLRVTAVNVTDGFVIFRSAEHIQTWHPLHQIAVRDA